MSETFHVAQTAVYIRSIITCIVIVSSMAVFAQETNTEAVVDPEATNEMIYSDAVQLARNAEYEQAIARWKEIPSTSSYYENAKNAIAKARERFSESLYNDAVEMEQQGKSLEAVANWKRVPAGTAYYERAREALKRYPPDGMQVNTTKTVLLFTSIGFGALAVTVGSFSILDKISDADTLHRYNTGAATLSTAEYDSLWRKHLDLVSGGNMKTSLALSLAVTSIGFFAWWLLTPVYIPEAKRTSLLLSPTFACDGAGMTLTYRF